MCMPGSSTSLDRRHNAPAALQKGLNVSSLKLSSPAPSQDCCTGEKHGAYEL